MKIVAKWKGAKPTAEEFLFLYKGEHDPCLMHSAKLKIYLNGGPQKEILSGGFDSRELTSSLIYRTERADDAIAFIVWAKFLGQRDFNVEVKCEIIGAPLELAPFFRRLDRLENAVLQGIVELSQTRKLIPNKSVGKVRHLLQNEFSAEMLRYIPD